MGRPSAETYSERAKRLRAMAESEPDPAFREKLLDLAKQYEGLVRQTERRGSPSAAP
jgi:hypothetical protein